MALGHTSVGVDMKKWLRKLGGLLTARSVVRGAPTEVWAPEDFQPLEEQMPAPDPWAPTVIAAAHPSLTETFDPAQHAPAAQPHSRVAAPLPTPALSIEMRDVNSFLTRHEQVSAHDPGASPTIEIVQTPHLPVDDQARLASTASHYPDGATPSPIPLLLPEVADAPNLAKTRASPQAQPVPPPSTPEPSEDCRDAEHSALPDVVSVDASTATRDESSRTEATPPLTFLEPPSIGFDANDLVAPFAEPAKVLVHPG